MKKFNIPSSYRSPLISLIKNNRRLGDKLKKDINPTFLDYGPLHIYLARHFGFCYGVENAIDISFRTIEENPDKRIFLLSEMIHNPQVNDDLQKRGVKFLMDTKGNYMVSLDQLKPDDIVIIPAFGTTIEIENRLKSIGIQISKYNTTCPFVEKVWNRAEAIAKNNYTIIVHGKPDHEETRATFSHSSVNSPTVVVNNMEQAVELGQYILEKKPLQVFYEEFKRQFSNGFNVEKDLERIGVVNQTTMLASDTQAIAEYLRSIMMVKYDLTENNVEERFADTKDTLCYATYDNQSAVYGLLKAEADLAIVIGGYNSSNTSHLVELCEEKLPTYFINSPENILSQNRIIHYNFHTRQEIETNNFLPGITPAKILIASGASCPDTLVEGVINRLTSFFPTSKSNEEIAEMFSLLQ